MKQSDKNWDALVNECLQSQAPAIDVRRSVRSALAASLEEARKANVLDVLAGIFDRPSYRWALCSCMSAAAIWAFCGFLFLNGDSNAGTQLDDSILLEDKISFSEDWAEFL